MVFVLVLSLIEDHSVNLTTLVIKVKFKIVLLTDELNNFLTLLKIHRDKGVVFEFKVVHLENSGITTSHVSHSVTVLGVLDLPVSVFYVVLAHYSHVNHFVVGLSS